MDGEGGIATLSDIEGVVGGDGDDVLRGRGSDETLMGNRGADTLKGRGGDDTLDGGDFVDPFDGRDVALFDGDMGQYTFSVAQPGRTVAVADDGAGTVDDGTDTLHGVDLARFSDGEIALISESHVGAGPGDFDRATSSAALPDGGYVVVWRTVSSTYLAQEMA